MDQDDYDVIREIMDERMNHIDTRFDHMEEKFDATGEKIDRVDTKIDSYQKSTNTQIGALEETTEANEQQLVKIKAATGTIAAGVLAVASEVWHAFLP